MQKDIRFLYGTTIFIVSYIIEYFLISFVKLEFNPLLWSEISRMLFSLLIIINIWLASGVFVFIRKR